MKTIEFLLIVEPEMDGPKGFFATGDDAEDARIVAKIEEDVKWNEWAWCMVTVVARFGPFEGRDHLGGCSYDSEKDFKEGGYYDDMKTRALEDLKAQIESAREHLTEFDAALEVLK